MHLHISGMRLKFFQYCLQYSCSERFTTVTVHGLTDFGLNPLDSMIADGSSNQELSP
jgi:hypothetical protein